MSGRTTGRGDHFDGPAASAALAQAATALRAAWFQWRLESIINTMSAYTPAALEAGYRLLCDFDEPKGAGLVALEQMKRQLLEMEIAVREGKSAGGAEGTREAATTKAQKREQARAAKAEQAHLDAGLSHQKSSGPMKQQRIAISYKKMTSDKIMKPTIHKTALVRDMSQPVEIGCDGCEKWVKSDELGLTAEEANALDKFYCHACKKKRKAAKKERKKAKKRGRKEFERAWSGSDSGSDDGDGGGDGDAVMSEDEEAAPPPAKKVGGLKLSFRRK